MTALREENLFRMNLRHFYLRRLARIGPLLTLVVSLSLLVVSTCALGSTDKIPQSALAIFSPAPKNFDAVFFFRC